MKMHPDKPRGYGYARSVPEKSDSALYGAEPVSDYWDAMWRVVAHLDSTGEYYDSGPLPWAAQFVADMFWVHPERVRADLVRFRKAQVD